MTWGQTRLADVIDFNPKVVLEKGKSYPFIAMDRINPMRRYVKNSENKLYNGGGAKFAGGDILFARITPCLQNGKILSFSEVNCTILLE
jgi:type I restriction enzyme S subunit